MAASGENDYSNWLAGSVACPSSSIPDEDDDAIDEIVLAAVRKELSHKSSSRRASTVEERKASVEKLVRQSSRKSSRASNSSPSHIDKAVKYTEMHDDSDTNSGSAETYDWDVVQIKPAEDVSALTPGESSSRRWKLICIALLCVLVIATAVTVPLVLLLNKDDGASNVPAGSLFAPEPPSQAPTPPPSLPLPASCVPLYDAVDECLSTDLSPEEADFCVDCVWRFLPANQGYCEPLEVAICNVVSSCGCSFCEDELLAYLDCQTECLIDCQP